MPIEQTALAQEQSLTILALTGEELVGLNYVLIHGGQHGAWCWARLIPLLDGTAMAVDLPGRAGHPGTKALRDLRLADFIESVVSQVQEAGLDRVVLVGHSMAGLSVPAVAAALGDRVVAVILLGAVVPPAGKSMVDDAAPALRPFLRARFSRQARRPDGVLSLPRWMAKQMFCNDMGAVDTQWVLDRIVADAPAIGLEPVPRVELDPRVLIAYVKMTRDRAVRPKQADRIIARLGSPMVKEIDAGHDVMVSDPRQLATVIHEIVGGLHQLG